MEISIRGSVLINIDEQQVWSKLEALFGDSGIWLPGFSSLKPAVEGQNLRSGIRLAFRSALHGEPGEGTLNLWNPERKHLIFTKDADVQRTYDFQVVPLSEDTTRVDLVLTYRSHGLIGGLTIKWRKQSGLFKSIARDALTRLGQSNLYTHQVTME